VSKPKNAFRLPVRVRFHECDPLGHVNNAVYLHYLEQAAIDHATTVGWSQPVLEHEVGGVFVARRHEIDYLRSAVEGDLLEVMTWAETMGLASALRRYVIRKVANGDEPGSPGLINTPNIPDFESGDVVVKAQTRWALVRRDTGRPMPVPRRVIDSFVESGQGDSNDP